MPNPLNIADITTDHARYAERRPTHRAQMIPVRRERRVRVGDILAFAFENAATLTYQVQEMVYTERLTDPSDVAHELDLYGRMLPTPNSLVATMLIELRDPATIKDELARLEGLQRSVSISVGGHNVPAEEINGPDEEPGVPSTLVSVHVLRFRFSDPARDAFRDPTQPAELVVDHPEFADSTALTGATRMALLADLSHRGG